MARRTWTFALVAVVCVAAVQGLDAYAKGHMFLVNRSPSLPNWAFFIERGAVLERGRIAFFTAPRNELVRKHFGETPALFGKRVLGLPGDIVVHRDGHAWIRQAHSGGGFVDFDAGALKPLTSSGERLDPGPTGAVPKGCYFMGSPHKDGFDSRYAAIGFVCSRQVVGVARRVIL